MSSQILINCGSNWFEFTKSKTGQLDYIGKNEKINQRFTHPCHGILLCSMWQ